MLEYWVHLEDDCGTAARHTAVSGIPRLWYHSNGLVCCLHNLYSSIALITSSLIVLSFEMSVSVKLLVVGPPEVSLRAARSSRVVIRLNFFIFDG